MTRKLFLAALVLCPVVMASGQPDFSGEWKLNLQKSDFGQMSPPDKWVRRVVHREPQFELASVQTRGGTDATWEAKLKTDGSKQTFPMAGAQATGSLKWDGAVLVLDTHRQTDQGDIYQTERWSLSPDGKTLTCMGKLKGDMGETELKLVFEK
ncbi:MAG: hypothetical protein K2X35_00745 [Bryobacteraceae bacterium]|nr:hypothetical protein [Bryobacteraceae bacterium]